ncbi:hypothetical protein V473_18190 [Sphingobium cupriresistens LL01]|uniref:Uncharacterized protein n=1 Tax=Sphingobium cupriresistens LL01 TaxID=1420583 RepID=A0A0J7XT34_9SPHN|nr:hypothetical protein V473_18190 [Sphingobium cupriresistens LL01]
MEGHGRTSGTARRELRWKGDFPPLRPAIMS